MARKAVAATLASVLLFTALVAADSTMMVANDDLASSAQASHIESRESLLAQYSAGLAVMHALAEVQAYASADPADCSRLPQYVGSLSVQASASGEDSGISYSSNVSAIGVSVTSSPVFPADNLTVVAPFSGYLLGALNLQAALSVREVGGGGSLSLTRDELHVLHLPISLADAASLCAYTLGSLAASLSSARCNASLAQAGFDSLMPSLIEAAAARGFLFAAGWALGAGCSATFWIVLIELAVAGVTGSFDWMVRGSGSTA